MRILEATVEFVWWLGGVIFVSNLSTVEVKLGDLKKLEEEKHAGLSVAKFNSS